MYSNPASRHSSLKWHVSSLFFGRGPDPWILLAFVVFTLPFTLPVLDSFFTFDDLQNLWHYLQNPARALLSNLAVFTSYRRPAGALFYLPSYWLFGVEPLPLYVADLLLYYVNLGLFYVLVLRLTSRRLSAVLALLWFAFHPNNYNVLFNFGAVYELLTCSTLLFGLLVYHRYRSKPEGEGSGLYWLVIIIYLLGLNAKETVVVLPLLLFLLEAVYFRICEWKANARRLGPFFAIAVIYTCVKVLGPEALWRTNPLYVFQFDTTFLFNLANYFSALLYWNVDFSVLSLFLALGLLTGIALVLRDRHLIFGLLFFLTALLPVLMLPRVWALFLYVPNCGFALYLGRLSSLTIRFVGARVGRYVRIPRGRIAWALSALALLLSLRLALVESAPTIRYASHVSFFSKTHDWRSFCSQLVGMHPVLAQGARLGFHTPPFNFDSEDRWALHFLVWLEYGRDLAVYQLPQQEEDFRKSTLQPGPVYEFEWEDNTLRTIRLPETE